MRIPGFGTFKVTNRKARKARNPQTGVGDDAEGGAGAQVPGLEEPEGHAELSSCDLAFGFFAGRAAHERALCFGEAGSRH